MTPHGASSRSRSRSRLESSKFCRPKGVTTDSREEETKWNGAAGGVKTVAIVGAGFAGLVLANYLERYRKDRRDQQQEEEGILVIRPIWTYKLFESKPSSGIPVIGTICLESAREVLEELRLFEEACTERDDVTSVFPQMGQAKSTSTAKTKNDRYKEVSRESFLELLRKNTKIQSSRKVVDIVIEEGGRTLKEMINNPYYFVVVEGDNGERMKHGPFDLVVAANGLSFRGETTETLQQTLKLSSQIVKIGDSRYRYGRPWWQFDFLGMTRRKSGADTAIRDGLEVGRRLQRDLVQETHEKKQLCRSRVRKGVCGDKMSLLGIPSVSFQNDCGRLHHEKVLNLVRIAVVILVPILLAMKFYY